jgi:hypothetical protein
MATTLDSMVNLRNPLGLTSLMGTPVKEKPTVAPSSQAAFPSIERPADPRPEIERRRGEIETTSSNIDVQIINNLAQQGEFQGQQAKQKAESEAQSLRELDTSRKALEKSLYESPAYKTIQEKSRELAEKSTFNPDQQNAQTLAAVFSIIGAAGFLLGGNNKNTAKAALSAMNGMAEGYSKGRDQYAKDQRLAFETNQKALRGTLDSLEKAFTLELEQNKNDLESATRNAKIAALERDASFINANIDKYGLVSTLEQLRSNKKRLETVLGALQKKEDAYSAEMQKEWFANESKKATAAAAQERVRYQEQERTVREQERRQDQERRDIERREDTQAFQREMARFRVENRPEKLAPGEKLSATKEKKIDGLNSITSGLDKLKKDFKPEYAGLGVFGFGADLELEAARRGLGKKEANDAARWWGRYNQYQAPNRHALFGATLTGNELKNYQSFTAKPSDSAQTVRGFIDDQINYSKDILDVTAPAGYKPKAKTEDYESTFGAPSPAPQPSAAQPSTGPYIDPDKERRYQDWKARQPK